MFINDFSNKTRLRCQTCADVFLIGFLSKNLLIDLFNIGLFALVSQQAFLCPHRQDRQIHPKVTAKDHDPNLYSEYTLPDFPYRERFQ